MRRLPLLLILLAGCAVRAELPKGTFYSKPLERTSSPAVEEAPSLPESAVPTRPALPVAGSFITVYSPTWCEKCKDVPDHPQFKKLHTEPFPGWVTERGEFPLFHWKTKRVDRDGKPIWYALSGWKGMDWLIEEVEQSNIEPPVRLGYPLRGSWWSHPGSIRDHLMGPPHNFSPEYVRSLSDAEAESLHSDDHEGRVKGNPPRGNSRRVQRTQRSRRWKYKPAEYCPPGST